MPVKEWREQAAAAAKLEKQEFGQIEAEKLFQPTTKRLDTVKEEPEPAAAGPNYTMDELDRINPFDWEKFQLDAETTPLSEEEGE